MNIRGFDQARQQWRQALVVLIAGASLAGCDFVDDLLAVDAPTRVIGGTLAVPANANLLVESTIADFECAYAFYAMTTGLASDELIDTQLAAATWDYDRRSVTRLFGGHGNSCNNTGNVAPPNYTALSMARWSADNVLRLLEGWTDAEVSPTGTGPSRQALIARAAAYGGYSLTLMGEAFCSAAIDGGPEMTSAQLFQEAETRFTTAIAAAQATNQADILNLALVGRARVRLNLGKKAEAATDAKLVPETFVKNAAYNTASSRSGNHVFRWNNRFFWASVDARFQNLSFGGVADSRVRVVNTGLRGADAFTIVWHQQKYATEASPIPIANWQEAQLIIAEAEGGASAVAAINRLHAKVNLPAFSSSDPAAITAQIIDERRSELFLTGHRMYDIRRFNVPLIPAAGAEYPIKGGSYGEVRCFELPEIERVNNPTLSGR